ncbi:MAG TPA: ATP-binding protein, partial [Chryseosolibacter sp.]|nr:ATP-binding protein [Chryseosolibacter sp.]
HLKLIIYRAVQELVNNAMKHAKAEHVLVQISQRDDIITIVVEDNGKGFDTHAAKGMGLINLEKKVRNLNGQLTIESTPGEGASIQIEFNTKTLSGQRAIATPV